jgi:hypothetical protein
LKTNPLRVKEFELSVAEDDAVCALIVPLPPLESKVTVLLTAFEVHCAYRERFDAKE